MSTSACPGPGSTTGCTHRLRTSYNDMVEFRRKLTLSTSNSATQLHASVHSNEGTPNANWEDQLKDFLASDTNSGLKFQQK